MLFPPKAATFHVEQITITVKGYNSFALIRMFEVTIYKIDNEYIDLIKKRHRRLHDSQVFDHVGAWAQIVFRGDGLRFVICNLSLPH